MNGQSQSLSRTLKHFVTYPVANAISISPATCEAVLYQCANNISLTTTKKVHAFTFRSGLLSSSNSIHFLSLLVAAYAVCGHVSSARILFDGLAQRTLRSYKSMVRMYAENGPPKMVLNLFSEMLESDVHNADKYTYPFVIRACGDMLLLELGLAVHGLALISGNAGDSFAGNSLLAMYMKCGDTEGAKRVFESMNERTVVSWNTMISGYFRNGGAEEALVVYQRLVKYDEVEPDSATVVSVLSVCGFLKNLEAGREIHLLAKEKRLGEILPVSNALMDMYVKCGRMDEARKVFDDMMEKDIVSWTTMINGCNLNDDLVSAVEFCRLMQLEGLRPNEITVTSLLAACANLPDLRLGRCLHGWSIRHKVESDVNVETALIDLYAKCNHIGLSFQVMSRTCKKRTVPWNAILSGCIQNKLPRKAIELFKQMMVQGVKPNEATFKSLLPAYASEADLQQAVNIHCYLIRAGFVWRPDIATALVDLYSKCGTLEFGHQIFNSTPAMKRDIVSWGAIIAGYAMHGHGMVALTLFYDMIECGVVPNEVTFTSVLHGCSHAGLVDDGLRLFSFIHGCHPACLRTNHYTCMVDLLGRVGRLPEAYALIKSMPFQPNHSVWGALLGACVIHENVELGEEAAKWLFELEPENTGNYVMMGNIYAALGRWKDAEKIRCMMNKIGLLKSPAHSVFS